MGIHLLASNFLATSTAENLNASHPIRRMLRPHTYGAINVNLGALQTLGKKDGILHRSVALTWKGVSKAFEKSFQLQRLDREHAVRVHALLFACSESRLGLRLTSDTKQKNAKTPCIESRAYTQIRNVLPLV